MTESPVGPSGHLLLGHLPALQKDPLGFLTHCARNYGAIVPIRLLGRQAFLLMAPADIERVLVTDHRNFVKPLWLRSAAVRRVLGDGLVTSDGSPWRRQRQICQPAFHRGLMEDYAGEILTLTEQMLHGWQPGQTRDIQRELTGLTLEITAQTLFGVKMAGWIEETHLAMQALMAWFASGRSLFGLVPLPAAPQERRAGQKLDRIVTRLIRQHKTPKPTTQKPGNLLSLLRRSGGQGQQDLSERELREQVKTFLVAGHESSALALSWTFLLLARNPEADARLVAELQAVVGDRRPTFADLPRLKFTAAIIQETLRLYPPLWMTGRQAVAACEIGGFQMPAGSLLLTSQWAVQRDPRHFPQPDAFRPERWEGAETADLPRFAYFPFGGGPRVCIGQNFALMEMTLLLAAISQRFRLELGPDTEIQPWATLTLHPPSGILMSLTTREQMARSQPAL